MSKDSALVKKDHDLSAQMTARKEKLSWLIGFVNDNGVLVKVREPFSVIKWTLIYY